MSIILDALRRGRARETRFRRHANPAQAGAVLQTLSSNRVNAITPWNRIKRLPRHLLVGLACAIASWAVVVRTTGEDRFERARARYAQVEALNTLGVLYRDKGLVDEAIAHFQLAIAIDPGNARARNNLGLIYLDQRKLEAAAAQFHAALVIEPGSVESLANLSTMRKVLGAGVEVPAAK